MTSNLQESYLEINKLLKALPCQNTCRSSSELNVILHKYLKILDGINSYSDAYKSATSIYYSDITSIRDHFQHLLLADSTQEKDKAFEAARQELESDLNALAILIKTEEESFL